MSLTVQLSDTIDQYSRKIHVNQRSGKVTMVYRWKDRDSSKAHTQRMTLDAVQLGTLIGLLIGNVTDDDAAQVSDIVDKVASETIVTRHTK